VNPAYARIYAAVRRVPRGRVATYGQVARLAGLPGRARLVGRALGELSEGAGVPWHRVVNASGGISPRGEPVSTKVQRRRLEREGVRFTPAGRVLMKSHQWAVAAEPGLESFRRLG
jgi:methylated-DNA-protein-cysteine methyltransferase related protein